MAACITTSTSQCTCAHSGHEHALVRCGCSNTDHVQTHGDPLQHADDAFHRVWCCTCMSYCSKDAQCPLPLPGVRLTVTSAIVTKQQRSVLLQLPYHIISMPFQVLVFIRTWFGKTFSFRSSQPQQQQPEPAVVAVAVGEKANC
ncbi:hypothetical protein EST38_g8374 [Candolleomyces aberdarensis]|uniref:Uncharacterized protein n=1 Tax=Candolleomyces aberdarensis TaxID=2316362 RepID=A0A4Q2DEZ5_9AGAR|nr:hypothetical protein EST38_g8374 [Candolleomyces aberdarensis]